MKKGQQWYLVSRLLHLGRGQQKRSERNLAGALLHVDAGKGVSPTYAYKAAKPYLSLPRLVFNVNS